MLSVLKNNYFRILARLPAVLIMTIITFSSIVFAVYFTGKQQVKGHIVLVSQTETALTGSSGVSIEVKPEEPPYSDLVKQKYDAYVIDNGNGDYAIKTLKSDDFKAMIAGFLKNPGAPLTVQTTERGVGMNIVGFLMMFLLMQTAMFMFPFADDKEKGQLVRIATTPISFPGYLTAHCLSCLSMFLPPYLMLIVMKLLGFDIGFSLGQYALFFILIGLLGISLSVLLNTLIQKPDNANMLGNSILALTSVLAGSFYSFSKGNAVLDFIIRILPQKQLMDYAGYLQNGCALAHPLPLLYTTCCIVILFTVSCVLLIKKYVNTSLK